MNFKHFRVMTKLMTGFAAMALLVLLVSALAIYSLSASNDRFAGYLSGDALRERLANDIRAAADARAIAARNIVLVTSQFDRDLELAKVNESHAQMGRALAALKDEIDGDAGATLQDREFLELLSQIESKYGPVALDIVKKAMADDREGAVKKMNIECRPLLAQLVKTSSDYLRHIKQVGDQSVAASQASYVRDRSLLTVACILATIAAVALGWLLSAVITRPLSYAVKVAEAVAEGDLSSQIVVTSTDETGQLLHALKRMNGSLRLMILGVQSTADGIANASAEISDGNQNLSSRTEYQASALQETATSMQQMTATVQQNADASKQANELATTAAAVASQGGSIVGQVVETMGSISTSSKRIGDIIGVIDSIAFQTNILALNAAVEAARAGEQGRGFAVVASEVRGLAQRSAAAAKEIKTLVGESVSQIEAGCSLVENAGKTMTDIVSQVQRVADLIADINTSTSHQSSGISQVNQAVTAIDEGTQQNAALVEQSAAAAESLKQQSAGLLKSVERFKTLVTQ